MAKRTICLNMIVKDEAHVIRRCLASVLPLIDSWVIVDTGSSDGTQDVIREALKSVPGTLFERPWKDFGYNRSEAIQLAKGAGDYLLFIDADDFIDIPAGFSMPALTADAYDLTIEYGVLTYRRACLVSNALPWRYVGVLHEYPECDRSFSRGRVDGVRMRIGGGGGRSRIDEKEKYSRDAELLERALVDEPENRRYAFYLAQSYRDSSQHEKSLAAYERRAAMGGFDEEVFCSLLEAARLARRLGRPSAEITDRFLRAYQFRPRRAEPLGELAMYCREEGKRWPLAFLFASRAIQIPMPDDVLFLGHPWYEWRCLDEYAIAAYWVGEYQKSLQACESLLQGSKLPQPQRARVLGNLNFAREKLGLSPVSA